MDLLRQIPLIMGVLFIAIGVCVASYGGVPFMRTES